MRTYAEEYGLSILVETGTYLGDMVEAMKGTFQRIYSIELSADLFQAAAKRFKGDSHVHLIRGDSANEIHRLVASLEKPALFWLDGHYSGVGNHG